MHSQHFISPKVEFLNSSTSTRDESGRGSPGSNVVVVVVVRVSHRLGGDEVSRLDFTQITQRTILTLDRR